MEKWSPAEEKPLGVTRCKRTDCNNDLHCFLKDRKRNTAEGTCLECGTDLIDWARVHRRDVRDVEHTIEALKHEHVRHEFWCAVELTERALTYARKRGRTGMQVAAHAIIRTSVGKPRDAFDGRRTPWETSPKAHILHFAQHATATCCRQCIQVWYGIPTDRPLNEADIEYFAQLLFCYVTARIPDLADNGMRLPRKTQPMTKLVLRRAS